MTDAELLRQAQHGDREAWSSLYANCLPSVWRHAVLSVGDHSVAEDIVGETLLAMVRSLSKLDADTIDVHAWLRGVLRRKIVDHYRQQSKQSRVQAGVRQATSEIDEINLPASPIEEEENRQLVREILEQLPEPQRLVLEWQHLDGLTVRDMAGRTGKSEKAIESILFRARKEFRRLFEQSRSETYPNAMSSRRTSDSLQKSL